jgi:transmembrane sensor
MTREEYILLYDKCISGRASEEENKLLLEYEDDYSKNFIFHEQDDKHINPERDQRIYNRVQKSIKGNPTRKLINFKQPLAAAIFFCLLSFGIYYFWPAPVIKEQRIAQILPGSSKAILTLGNGEQVLLDGKRNGILRTHDNAVIKKENDGKIIYNNASTVENELLTHHTITIPRQGEYQLVLADGTKVWLNSESSLRFPVAFKGTERKVELTGEGYFEVAKDKKKPFIVQVKSTEVRVLGTHFNINAYNAVNTTLIEGAVELKNSHHEVLLKPGESGSIQHNNLYKIEKADIEAIVSWKNGYFVFHNEEIKSIMEKVSRWYGVKVEYQGNVEHLRFYGKVSRSGDITELLKNIELTGAVRFKIKTDNTNLERRIIVMI